MLADVDGDHKADRVMVDPNANWVAATTTGRLPKGWPSNPVQFGAGNWDQMLGDLDGDGVADRVAVDSTNGASYALTSTGAFPPPGWGLDPQIFGGESWTPFLADVDGDGKADRITINPAGPTWYAATTSGLKTPSALSFTAMISVRFSSLNPASERTERRNSSQDLEWKLRRNSFTNWSGFSGESCQWSLQIVQEPLGSPACSLRKALCE
jgi:hypothetical protein